MRTDDAFTDPYADGTAQSYWHLSRPSPELLEALEKGWLLPRMRVLDLGCGLASDIGYLAGLGFDVTGIDLFAEALARARQRYRGVKLIEGDVRRLPFADSAFDYLLDRGCFHYLPREHHSIYAVEAMRVLRPGGELLLRACTNNYGRRNEISRESLLVTFAESEVLQLDCRAIPTDSRQLEALCARLRRPEDLEL